MHIGRFLLALLSRDKWTWGAWQLHVRRAGVAASLWLIVLTILAPSAQSAHAQGGISEVACDALEVACNVTGFLREVLPDWLAQLLVPTPHDEFDFRWRPHCRTPPQSGCWFGNWEHDPGTDVMTAVNVGTYFWAIGNLEYKMYFRPLPLIPCATPGGALLGSLVWIHWTWVNADNLCLNPQWCFGDGNWGCSPRRDWWAIRPDIPALAQYYEFSSYGQDRRTRDGQPAFDVTMITFWKLEIDCVVVCYIVIEVPPFIIPYPCNYAYYGPYQPIPICKDHAVAVKQVQSVLVPGPAWPIPQE